MLHFVIVCVCEHNRQRKCSIHHTVEHRSAKSPAKKYQNDETRRRNEKYNLLIFLFFCASICLCCKCYSADIFSVRFFILYIWKWIANSSHSLALKASYTVDCIVILHLRFNRVHEFFFSVSSIFFGAYFVSFSV